MKASFLCIAVFALMPVGVLPAAQARAAAACPSTPARLAEIPKLELPPDAKPTSKEIAFEVDVGSDGRVRGLQLDEPSGDGAIDLSLRQTLQAAHYDPPQTGCVAYSGGLRLSYGLPVSPDAPTPGPPAKLNTACVPYIHAYLTPEKRDRSRTGTAIVAVELDAAATRTAPPVIKQSTGSAVLDAEALRIARTGQYGFVSRSPCAPQPFTYELELTFQ